MQNIKQNNIMQSSFDGRFVQEFPFSCFGRHVLQLNGCMTDGPAVVLYLMYGVIITEVVSVHRLKYL